MKSKEFFDIVYKVIRLVLLAAAIYVVYLLALGNRYTYVGQFVVYDQWEKELIPLASYGQ